MSRSDRITLGDTHRMWHDAVPVVPFPFRYSDKEGEVRQTWSDIKEKLGNEATSQAIPFSTAHIAPSQMHSLILAELNEKSEKTSSRLQDLLRLRASRPSSAPADRQTPTKPMRPLSALERAALFEGEGGGRNRSTYLKLRRMLPSQLRDSIRRTTSQGYGWEQLDRTDAATSETAITLALQAATTKARFGTARITEFLPIQSEGRVEQRAAVAVAGQVQRQRQPGVDKYFGRRSVVSQMTRKTGAFAKPEWA